MHNKKKKGKGEEQPIYLELENGKTLKILSIENYVTPEEKYANKLIDEYIKRCKEIPNA